MDQVTKYTIYRAFFPPTDKMPLAGPSATATLQTAQVSSLLIDFPGTKYFQATVISLRLFRIKDHFTQTRAHVPVAPLRLCPSSDSIAKL